MAVKKDANFCVSTHVERKEDEGTLIMTINDIKSKISSAEPGEGIESGMLKCGDIEFRMIICPNGIMKDFVGNISCGIFIENHGQRQWRSIEFLVAENSCGAFLKTSTELLENLSTHDACFDFKKGITYNKMLPHNLVLAEKNSSFFPNGVLTVKVNIKIEVEETVTTNTTKLLDMSITTSHQGLSVTPPANPTNRLSNKGPTAVIHPEGLVREHEVEESNEVGESNEGECLRKEREANLSARNKFALTPLVPQEESMKRISLTSWIPFLWNKKLYIEGDLNSDGVLSSDSRPKWITSKIVSRISEKLVTTKKTCYVLEGQLAIPAEGEMSMPLFVFDKFKNGIPENWRNLTQHWIHFNDQSILTEASNQTILTNIQSLSMSMFNSTPMPGMMSNMDISKTPVKISKKSAISKVHVSKSRTLERGGMEIGQLDENRPTYASLPTDGAEKMTSRTTGVDLTPNQNKSRSGFSKSKDFSPSSLKSPTKTKNSDKSLPVNSNGRLFQGQAVQDQQEESVKKSRFGRKLVKHFKGLASWVD